MRVGKYMTMADMLTGEHKKAFDYVEAYSGARMCIGRYQYEKMMNLLDLLLTAQEEGQPAEMIVGTDLERFSREYFSDRTAYDLIEPILSKIKLLAWLVLIFEAVDIFSSMHEPGFNLFSEKTDVSVYLGGILAGYSGILLTDLISILLIKLKCFSRKIYFGMGSAFFLIATWFFVFGRDRDYKFEVPTFPVILSVALYLVAFYALRLFFRYRKTGTLKKPANQYETGFFAFVRTVFTNRNYSKDPRIINSYRKQYTKLNNKRLKKGIEPLPIEEFFYTKELESRYLIIAGITFYFFTSVVGSILGDKYTNTYVGVGLTVLWVCSLIGWTYMYIRIISNIAKKKYQRFPEDYQSRGMEFEELYEKYIELRKRENEERTKRSR